MTEKKLLMDFNSVDSSNIKTLGGCNPYDWHILEKTRVIFEVRPIVIDSLVMKWHKKRHSFEPKEVCHYQIVSGFA